MKKQYIITPCIVLALAIFLIIPKGKKLDVSYTSVQVQAMPQNGTILNVFLENSGSMDGYMCDGSEFKDAVKGFVSSMQSDFDTVSLNFINTTIIPRGNDVKGFIANMNVAQFKAAGGQLGNTDIGALIETVVKSTGKSTVSMFISDCILDIPHSHRLFTDRQIDVTNTIRRFQRQGNNAVVVIQLESVFKGNYYGVDGITHLNGEKRPYYIWLFGNAELIAKAIQNSPIESIPHGVKNWASFGKKQTLPFEITNKFGQNPTNIQPMGNAYEIRIKADLSRMLKSDMLLTNTTNYKTNKMGDIKVTSIVKTNEPNYTHIITLSINKNIATCAETLSYIDANRIPSWAETSNDDTGTNIRKNLSKTTGIKYIIQGVAEAYKAETSLGEIQFVIKNK